MDERRQPDYIPSQEEHRGLAVAHRSEPARCFIGQEGEATEEANIRDSFTDAGVRRR